VPNDHVNDQLSPLPEALPITTPSTAHLTEAGEPLVTTLKLTDDAQAPPEQLVALKLQVDA
jgi:hypothetical protein